tara:strand:- start:1760 stop:1951 length:192 start_codon:yes stop_codon:yes gene_type:complete
MKILIWVKLGDLYVLEKYLNNEIVQNNYQIEYSTRVFKNALQVQITFDNFLNLFENEILIEKK